MAISSVVIVESPAKAKTINKYLGSNFTVLASYGHIRDLPPKDGSVEPDNDFAMHWLLDTDRAKHLKEITTATKAADRVILATDPDREGEAISWHLLETLKAKKALPKQGLAGVERVTFNEITKTAVTTAMGKPRQLDGELIDAYLARRALDYLVGFTLSPVLWRKLPGARSAGRVQSVALRLVCQRETEIEMFKPREYWTILADMKTAKGETFKARLTHVEGKKLDKFDLNSETSAQAAHALVKAATYTVSAIEQKPATRNPYAPFTTSTLQQEAARKCYFAAQQTMRIAQSLYEGVSIGGEVTGLITYMRTDGVSISQEAIHQCRDVIRAKHGDAYVPEKPRMYTAKAKNAQEAHEGIRPTDLTRTPKDVAKYLSTDQQKLYELIWKRTLASQMASARMERTAVDLLASDKRTQFRASGQVLVFPGFLALYDEDIDDSSDDEDGARLPALTEGEKPGVEKVAVDQHFTEPPPRYSEASLVKKMEELGIGRPSTYASILQTLRDRDYVTVERNRFTPSDKGRLLTAFLEKFFTRYVEYDYTAGLEEQLDEISAGKLNWKEVLREFWSDFSPKTKEVLEQKPSEVIAALDQYLEGYLYKVRTDGGDPRECPSCHKGALSLRSGKFGSFLGCSNYPDCKYTRPFGAAEESEAAAAANGPRLIGEDPDTNEAITFRKGRFGPYLQRGEDKREDGEKPPRASIPKDVPHDTLDIEMALKLLSLPRLVGVHPETGEEIRASIGRYGPYLAHNKKYARLSSTEDVFNVGMNMAVTLLAAPPKFGKRGEARAPQPALKELGAHPESGLSIRVLSGKYGAYVTDGTTNATLPKNNDPLATTMEDAVALIAERVARGPVVKKGKKAVAKKAPKISSAKTTAKALPKKTSAVKKPPAKKPSVKKQAAIK